jgi:hypothetical protein
MNKHTPRDIGDFCQAELEIWFDQSSKPAKPRRVLVGLTGQDGGLYWHQTEWTQLVAVAIFSGARCPPVTGQWLWYPSRYV